MKWKLQSCSATFFEAAGTDCDQNDGLTGPVVWTSVKICEKGGENNEDYETEFLSSPPLLFIILYGYHCLYL